MVFSIENGYVDLHISPIAWSSHFTLLHIVCCCKDPKTSEDLDLVGDLVCT
jgi:hypothetical protein